MTYCWGTRAKNGGSCHFRHCKMAARLHGSVTQILDQKMCVCIRHPESWIHQNELRSLPWKSGRNRKAEFDSPLRSDALAWVSRQGKGRFSWPKSFFFERLWGVDQYHLAMEDRTKQLRLFCGNWQGISNWSCWRKIHTQRTKRHEENLPQTWEFWVEFAQMGGNCSKHDGEPLWFTHQSCGDSLNNTVIYRWHDGNKCDYTMESKMGAWLSTNQ